MQGMQAGPGDTGGLGTRVGFGRLGRARSYGMGLARPSSGSRAEFGFQSGIGQTRRAPGLGIARAGSESGRRRGEPGWTAAGVMAWVSDRTKSHLPVGRACFDRWARRAVDSCERERLTRRMVVASSESDRQESCCTSQTCNLLCFQESQVSNRVRSGAPGQRV
jgi:hypothetical protein